MLAAVLAASFLPVVAFADEDGAEGDLAGNEAVDKLAVSDQPAATEPEAPAESDQPAATEPGAPEESEIPAEPEALAESDQPAETESGASAVQPAAESQDTPPSAQHGRRV